MLGKSIYRRYGHALYITKYKVALCILEYGGVWNLPVDGMADEYEAGHALPGHDELVQAGGRHEELQPIDHARVQGSPNIKN